MKNFILFIAIMVTVLATSCTKTKLPAPPDAKTTKPVTIVVTVVADPIEGL